MEDILKSIIINIVDNKEEVSIKFPFLSIKMVSNFSNLEISSVKGFTFTIPLIPKVFTIWPISKYFCFNFETPLNL